MSDRTCSDCGVSAADTRFVKDKRARDGLGPTCLPCNRIRMKATYQRHKAKRNAESRAHYETNREVVLIQQREYRLANLESIRKYDRDRYAADPEKRRAQIANWVAVNREYIRAQQRKSYFSNRDMYLDRQGYARVAAAGFDAECEPIIRREVWESYERCCGICLEPVLFGSMELDHIKPISKGGAHLFINVQPAHKSCNSSKKDKEVYHAGLARDLHQRNRSA